jgi:predicted phosphate transport protein (TIGR00153 family)
VFRIFPREENFLPQFGRAAQVILDAARVLDAMAADLASSEDRAAEIKRLEHQGDQIAHETFDLLNRTWITPIDREDIHTLVKTLDDVLDYIDAAASRIVLYRITTTTPELKKITAVIVQSAIAIQKAMALLSDLKHSRQILDACVEINRLENEADTVAQLAIGKLFAESKDPIEVMKWKEIYDFVEGATDRCEDVANTLEAIVIKST